MERIDPFLPLEIAVTAAGARDFVVEVRAETRQGEYWDRFAGRGEAVRFELGPFGGPALVRLSCTPDLVFVLGMRPRSVRVGARALENPVHIMALRATGAQRRITPRGCAGRLEGLEGRRRECLPAAGATLTSGGDARLPRAARGSAPSRRSFPF